MEDRHKTEIIGAIGELKGKVEVGFNGTNKRLDISNHRAEKMEERVGKLEVADAGIDNRLESVEKNTKKLDGRAWEIVKYVLMGVIGAGLALLFNKL